MRRLLAIAVSISSTLVFPVLGQTPTPSPEVTGVQISPARHEADLPSRDISFTVLVTNLKSERQHIIMSAADLGHDLDGTPLFIEPPSRAVLSLSESDFFLDPSARKEIVVKGRIPQRERSHYAGIIAEFESIQQAAGVVEARSRVASLVLLRAPRPWVETAEVIDVGILPGSGEGPLVVYATLRNTGNVHIRPTGRIMIFKDNQLLDTIPLERAIVIPTFARRFKGNWTPPPGLTGRLRLLAIFEDPSAQGEGFVDFTEGEFAGRGVTISNLRPRAVDGRAVVNFTITNTGTIPIGPTIHITASREELVNADRSTEEPLLSPQESRSIEWRPELTPGIYAVKVQATLGDLLLDEAFAGLDLRTPPAPFPFIPLLATALFLLILISWLLLFLRRKKKERDENA